MKAKEDFVVISDESNHPSPLHKPLPSSKQLPYKRLLLNGFLLLDASNNVFPDNALEADISGKGYSAVQTEDLEYFTRLEFLNGSENALQLFDLSRLSTLRDLRLNFNRMRNIALPINGPGFESLLSLDLSYNRLIPESFLPLQSLPVLKILGTVPIFDHEY